MPASGREDETTAAARRMMALVNPQAGSFAAQQEFLPLVEATGGRTCSLASPGDLEEALREAERHAIERLIIVGGDGSVSHTVNALEGRLAQFELAIIPAGTGNDLARSLGIPVDDLATAWQWALQGPARPIDLVQVGSNGHLVANSITAGFESPSTNSVDRDQKSSWGKLAYWLTALAKLGDMRDFRLAITTPEFAKELEVYGFWIANGRYVGGGFCVTPTALLDDGMFDVVAIPAGGTLHLLSAGLDYATIGPEQSEQIVTFRTQSMQISTDSPVTLSVDGELMQAQDLNCSLLPSAVRFVTGTEPALSALPGKPILPG